MQLDRPQPVKLGRVRDILSHLAPACQAELDSLGLDSNSALREIKGMLRKGEGVMWYDGRTPVMAFGVTKEARNSWSTWFLATQEALESPSHIRAGRKALKKFARKHNPIRSVTRSKHKSVDRWFKLLGFERVPQRGRPAARIYEFKEKR